MSAQGQRGEEAQRDRDQEMLDAMRELSRELSENTRAHRESSRGGGGGAGGGSFGGSVGGAVQGATSSLLGGGGVGGAVARAAGGAAGALAGGAAKALGRAAKDTAFRVANDAVLFGAETAIGGVAGNAQRALSKLPIVGDAFAEASDPLQSAESRTIGALSGAVRAGANPNDGLIDKLRDRFLQEEKRAKDLELRVRERFRSPEVAAAAAQNTNALAEG